MHLHHCQMLIPAWRIGDPLTQEMVSHLSVPDCCASRGLFAKMTTFAHKPRMTPPPAPTTHHHRQPIDVSHWLFLLIFGVPNNRWSTAFLPPLYDRNVKCSQLLTQRWVIYYLENSAFGIFIRLFWPVNPSFKCCSHPPKCSVKNWMDAKHALLFLGLSTDEHTTFNQAE